MASSFVRSWVFAAVLAIGCDRGVEANQDNLSHFASVASELRRDARELDLLAKKVGAVKDRLERRKTEIAEHVYSDELKKQRDELMGKLGTAAAAVIPSVEGGTSPSTEIATTVADDALASVIVLHDQLFSPLKIDDDSLRNDNDYYWWLEELGLQSADSSNYGASPDEENDELSRSVDECRTTFDADNRASACANLLVNHLTSTHFGIVKRMRMSEIDSQIDRLTLIQKQFEDEAADRETSAAKVMAAYGSSFDGLIIWGFPALVIAVLVIVLFEGRRRKASDAPIPDTLAVVTVLLLVSAIIILGLGGKIQPEALGTLIGGISGYVLGKGTQAVMGGDKAKSDQAKPDEAKPALVETPPTSEPASVEPKPATTTPIAELAPVADDAPAQAKA
ncbi:hypothetical protein ACNOYE_11090 [Nannocystaceae bacterium ST9]